MPTKRRFQILLDETQLAAMRRLEEKTGAPVAAQVRLALNDWLPKQPVPPAAAPPKKRK